MGQCSSIHKGVRESYVAQVYKYGYNHCKVSKENRVHENRSGFVIVKKIQYREKGDTKRWIKIREQEVHSTSLEGCCVQRD